MCLCSLQASLAFPAVLKRLGLKAFDFSKVIELFVKNTRDLPKCLRRHLFVVEEQIIEAMAWEPGSSIYNLIRGAVAPEAPSTSQPPDMPRKECIWGGAASTTGTVGKQLTGSANVLR